MRQALRATARQLTMYIRTTSLLTRFVLILFIGCAAPSFAQDKIKLKIEGALRFNYVLSSWKDSQIKRGGDFGYDVFRIAPKVSYKGVSLNAEYRFYSNAFGGGMLKQGWFQFGLSAKDTIQLGLAKVPFGITPYNSNNWFFSINYYVGLEDDHDMGIRYMRQMKKFDLYFAYFKNAEEFSFGNNSDISNSRYAYDIASKDLNGDGELNLRNKEIHQFNAKVVYKLGEGGVKHRIGTSLQYGGIYNLDTEKTGRHVAAALHYKLETKHVGIKAQTVFYQIDPRPPDGETSQIIAMTAYGAPYFVAAEASTYTLGISYKLAIKDFFISELIFYNDFGYMDKSNSAFDDTIMNVLGIGVTTGPVFTYIDMASGKHMPWLNPDYDNSLGEGSTLSDSWETRFNINFGYYF